MRKFIARYPVLTFVLLTLGYQFAIVVMVWLRIPEGGHMHDHPAAHAIFRYRVFGPLAFAMGLTWYLEGRAGLAKLFGGFVKWRVPAKWYALAFSWKFLFTYIGIGALAAIGLRQWPGFIVPDFIGGDFSNLKSLLFTGMPFIVGIAFVEETSWMKFCVTRMQERFTAGTSCLIIGVAWGLWYLPMLLIGEGVPDGYPWPVFLLSMICLTVFLGWTYNMTRSGAILLIMQIVSNCAFFIMPVLPAWWDSDATFVNSFVAVNFASAVTLLAVFGWKDLGVRRRATWGEPHPEVEKAVPAPAHLAA